MRRAARSGSSTTSSAARRRVRATRAEITNTANAVSACRADHERALPDVDLGELVSGGYLPELPLDAWGRLLRLSCPGRSDPRGFDVSSDGPDGEPAGSTAWSDGRRRELGRTKLVEGESRCKSTENASLRPRDPRASRRRAPRAALTLVELVIVITIIGVIDGGHLDRRPEGAEARERGRREDGLQHDPSGDDAVEGASIPDRDCPTVEQLKTEKDLDTGVQA